MANEFVYQFVATAKFTQEPTPTQLYVLELAIQNASEVFEEVETRLVMSMTGGKRKE
jgi:hypothetical protein